MKRIALITTAALFMSFGTTIKADMFTPSDSCSEPWDRRKASQWEIDSFKSCIESFVDDMNNAAQNHRNAANDAINKWNNFASSY